jgi:hypothetical protein
MILVIFNHALILIAMNSALPTALGPNFWIFCLEVMGRDELHTDRAGYLESQASMRTN